MKRSHALRLTLKCFRRPNQHGIADAITSNRREVAVGTTLRSIVWMAIALIAGAVLATGDLQGVARQPATGPGTIVGDQWIHQVTYGETWLTIGARVGVDPPVLAARNGRAVDRPLRAGDVLGIDNRHIAPDFGSDGLLINIPQRMLFQYWDGTVRAAYPIAVGHPDWSTPLGPFSIIEMETDPTWDVPASIQNELRRAGKPVVAHVPPGPGNPLGKYWMRLSFGTIGLHGTTAPASIYHFATHGCIRLHPDDVDDLFHHVRLGEPGEIVYQPVLVGFDGTTVYLEVHGDPYNLADNRLLMAMDLLDRSGLIERVNISDVTRVVRQSEGLAIPLAVRRIGDH
jgi:L,D-transpeptidase ErfK/SrfK